MFLFQEIKQIKKHKTYSSCFMIWRPNQFVIVTQFCNNVHSDP